MKKLVLAALLFTAVSGFSQESKVQGQKAERTKLTSEQRNELKIKEMTLDLNLTDSQQKEMAQILADQETQRSAARAEMKANREKGVKPTSDEMYARRSKMLDNKIAEKERVKKILSKEQFEKWEKNQDKKKDRIRKGSEHKIQRKADKSK